MQSFIVFWKHLDYYINLKLVLLEQYLARVFIYLLFFLFFHSNLYVFFHQQLLVSFWQDESEHVRMAARTLFHCAASRAIPLPLCCKNANAHVKLVRSLSEIGENEDEVSKVGGPSTNGLASDVSPEPQAISEAEEYSDRLLEMEGITQVEESKVLAWLESFEVQDWISCVSGTSQDAMTSHIIVAAALAIWYPSLVKPSLATLVVHPLIKLVMAMNEKYSSTAAELLAEGMESTWKACNSFEIPRLIGDIFFQIECVSGPAANPAGYHPAVPSSIRETLVGVLLPSLAVADILGFLTVIEDQIWSTASDSSVHPASLMTLIRVVRGSPRHLAQYLDKVSRVNSNLATQSCANFKTYASYYESLCDTWQICRWLTSFYTLWTLATQSCGEPAFKVQWLHSKKLYACFLW